MNESFEFFKKTAFAPEVLFSADNPVWQATTKVHRSLVESFDTAARANLALASDLLDLNRRRVEELYSGKPISDQLQAHADIVLESGQRFSAWGEELREVATACRAVFADVASEVAEQPAKVHKPGRKSAKAA
jgi:hypothetical protein